MEIRTLPLEKAITFDRSPEENIAILKEVFKDSPDNLFVRGSFVRGDLPYDDIDISAYNPRGEYGDKDRPAVFMGIPIVYGGIPLEHLEEYFDTCLRGASSLMETVEIISSDPTPQQIIERQQNKFLQEKLPDYLLFLQTEEEISGRRYDGNRSRAYYDRKRERGSKRTISRMMWTVKSLYPDLYSIRNTKAAMQEAKERGFLPDDVIDDSIRVFELLSRDLVDPIEWKERTERLQMWTDGVLKPTVKKYVSHHLPADYVELIDTALAPESSMQALETAVNNADSLDVKHRKWTAIFSLSANSTLSSEGLFHIWNEYKDQFVYRNVTRNLLRNSSFPINAISEDDLPDDIYAHEAYIKRIYTQ